MTISQLNQYARRSTIALAVFTASGFFTINAYVGPGGLLRVVNNSNQPHKFTISQQGSNCIDVPTVGESFTIPAYGFHDVSYSKSGRSSCGLSSFSIAPSRPNGEYAKIQSFYMGVYGHMGITDQKPGYENYLHYRGSHPVESVPYHEWRVTGPNKAAANVGKPKGYWHFACQGGQNCTAGISSSVDRGEVSD